jgi:hypothetical protein
MLPPLNTIVGPFGASPEGSVVHALGPDPSARLPQREDGALRVLQHGHTAYVEYVERVIDNSAAELSRPRRCGMRVGDGDVAHPVRPHARRAHVVRHLELPADGVAVDAVRRAG